MKMIELLAFMGLGTWEIVIVIFVIVLLFGSTKIPTLMKSMGSGISQFKKGIKEGEKEAAEEAKKEAEEAASKKKEEGGASGEPDKK